MVEIRALDRENAIDAAIVLAHAFAGYPLLHRAFEGANRPQAAMRRMMFEWAMRYRLDTGIPAFVAVDGRQVVGAATMRTPDDPPLPDSADAGWTELEREMHPAGIALFDAYDRMQVRLMPTPKPAYLVAIGVEPARQGEGIGRALIEAAVLRAGSAGLMLDTHLEANVGKYLALGFDLYAEAELMGLPNWYFVKRSEVGKNNGKKKA